MDDAKADRESRFVTDVIAQILRPGWIDDQALRDFFIRQVRNWSGHKIMFIKNCVIQSALLKATVAALEERCKESTVTDQRSDSPASLKAVSCVFALLDLPEDAELTEFGCKIAASFASPKLDAHEMAEYFRNEQTIRRGRVVLELLYGIAQLSTGYSQGEWYGLVVRSMSTEASC
jgi:hypothetical protein